VADLARSIEFYRDVADPPHRPEAVRATPFASGHPRLILHRLTARRLRRPGLPAKVCRWPLFHKGRHTLQGVIGRDDAGEGRLLNR